MAKMSKKKTGTYAPQRSRKWLRDALLALIVEREYDKITVADITERAQVARPTFYLHFANKDDLLLSTMDSVLEQMQRDILADFSLDDDEETARALVLRFFEDVAANAPLYRVIINGQGGMLSMERFRKQTRQILQIFMQRSDIRTDDDALLDLLTHYLTGSSMAILRGWLEQGVQQSPEEMAALFTDLIQPGMARVLAGSQDS